MPALIICVALSLYFIALRYNEADAVLLGRGAALSRQLAPAAEYGAFSGNLDELQRLAEAAAREADVTAVTFTDVDGRRLTSVGNTRFHENIRSLPGNWQGASADGNTLYFHTKIQRSVPAFDDPFQPTPSGQQPTPQPLGSVTVEMSRSAVIRTKQEILIVTLMFSLAALVAGILFSRRLSRDVTEPILALQQAVTQIHLGNLDTRVAHHPGQTLHNLEAGINEMAAALHAGRDQLEQRIAEATAELREKKEEAERTSLAKSRFLAAASHDLRQPLHALTLFTDELEQQPHTQPQRSLLKQVHSAVDAMNAQLSALLDISRLDLGDIRARPTAIDLEPLIERAVAVHAPDAQAKGLRLRHAPTRARAFSDPRLLERMLGNLLSNAIRYTQRGGVTIGVRRHGDRLRLEIWDSGIGISAEQIPLIFQEFYQVDNPERDAEKGLGLGLSIVARLGQILDHPVSVNSRPGRGSVFSIVLPRAAAEPQAQDTAADALPEAPRGNGFGFDVDVLVLGDAIEESDRLCELLENWGCRTTCATSIGAFEERGAERPDVLIFDAGRLAAMSHFVERYPTPPILIMLGESAAGPAAAEDRPPCPQLGLPLRPARLRALLQRLLQKPGGEDEEEAAGCPVAAGTTA